MGFLQTLTSFGQQAKAFARHGLSYARRGAQLLHRGLGQATSLIDNILDFAHNVPILADLAVQFEQNEYYKGFREITDDLGDILANSNQVFDSIDGWLAPEGVAHLDEYDAEIPANIERSVPRLVGQGPRRGLPSIA